MKEVNGTTFETDVLKSGKVCVVDFWAPWCGPCKAFTPTLEALASEYQDKVDIVKLNVDDNGDLAASYSIRSLPTVAVFKDGKEVARVIGVQPKTKIQSLIEEHL